MRILPKHHIRVVSVVAGRNDRVGRILVVGQPSLFATRTRIRARYNAYLHNIGAHDESEALGVLLKRSQAIG